MEATDEVYLAIKTVTVFCIYGACFGDELINVTVGDVKDDGLEIIVHIPDSKTHLQKIFPISGNFADIVRKYIKLRPVRMMTDRFFIGFEGGKYTVQVMGKNVIAQIPRKIAEFLGLPDPTRYTGQSFRRASTTILADMGSVIETNKRVGKSSSVAEGYIQESLGNQRKILNPISSAINFERGTNNLNCEDEISNDESSDFTDSTDSSDDTDGSELSRHHRTKESKRKRRKRPERQKEIDWYDEESLAQIKLTTDMFKRFSKMREDDKMKMLSEFSMHRVELFKKYLAAMNNVATNPTNTPTMTTASSINTVSQNGGVANPGFVILKVNSLANTNDINLK